MKKILHLFLFSLLLTSCCKHSLSPDIDPEPPCQVLVPENIRVCLVLGSGGVRGMAHVGVIEALEEAGIPIDCIVGCSAGSIVGALYADYPCIEHVKEAVWNIKTATLLDIDLWNCRFGFCQGRSMRRVLKANLTAETFDELKIPLVIVASDLCTGELIPMASGDLVKSIESSCSIPLVYIPCRHKGRLLVDGGTISPVPVKVAQDLGAKLIIAVDLCELLPKTMPSNLFGIARRSAEIAFMWQNEGCTRNADIVIRPKTCGIGTFNETMKSEVYQAGKFAAQEQLPSILKALEELKHDTCNRMKLVCLKPYTAKICVND